MAEDSQTDDVTEIKTTTETTADGETVQYRPRLKALYNDVLRYELKDQLSIDNVMDVPRLTKIVVNVGVGEAVGDSKVVEKVMTDLATITGQKPQIRRAKKSIATFKLREGMPVGARVTLRNERMWDFLDRLLTLAIPRIRDFRGLPEKLDGGGNYTLGITEQLIFTEIDYDSIDAIRGMDITFVTTATNDEHGRALLEAFGFPFRRPEGAPAPEAMQRLVAATADVS